MAKVATMLKTKTAKTTPWMGVHVVQTAHSSLTVDAVDPSGPAAHAGLAAGDTIASIDGTAVATVDQLWTALSAHTAGDVVTVHVVHADQSASDVSVTLVAAPSM